MGDTISLPINFWLISVDIRLNLFFWQLHCWVCIIVYHSILDVRQNKDRNLPFLFSSEVKGSYLQTKVCFLCFTLLLKHICGHLGLWNNHPATWMRRLKMLINSRITAQVCPGLVTIKGHLQKCTSLMQQMLQVLRKLTSHIIKILCQHFVYLQLLIGKLKINWKL